VRSAIELIRTTLRSMMRDQSALFWSFAFPPLLLLGLCLIWGGGGVTTSRIGLAGDEGLAVGRDLRARLAQTPTFRLHTGTAAAELAALRAGERHLVLVCENTRPPVVRAYYDPRQEGTVRPILATAAQAVAGVERRLIGRPLALRLEERPIGKRPGPQPNPMQTFVAGIIGMMIIQSGLGAAVALVSERQKGNADIFRIAPISTGILVSASLAARVLIAGAQAIAVVAVGLIALGVRVEGSLWVLGLLVVLGTLAFTAVGEALAMIARNVETMSGLVSLVSLPLIFLSGLFFPIDTLPGYAQSLALALPSAYLGDGLRWAVSGVSQIAPVSVSILILTVCTVGCFLFSVKFYRWE
jgi:ABC-2 type transport system permease protein